MLMLGKTRGAEAEALLAEYVKRIARWCPIEVNELRDGEAALKKLDADRAATVRLLDAGGRAYDSAAFAKWMGEMRDRGTREIVFVCGDAAGFPEALRERVPQKISLSATQSVMSPWINSNFLASVWICFRLRFLSSGS